MKVMQVLRSLIPSEHESFAIAKELAQILLTHGAEAIYLFGSVARQGGSNKDIDIIAIVSDDIATEFLKTLLSESRKLRLRRIDGYFNAVETRLRSAGELIGISKYVNEFNRTYGDTRYGVDIFLFPPDWRTNPLVWDAISSSDSAFKDNVIRDVRLYNPSRNAFNGIGLKRLFAKYSLAYKSYMYRTSFRRVNMWLKLYKLPVVGTHIKKWDNRRFWKHLDAKLMKQGLEGGHPMSPYYNKQD